MSILTFIIIETKDRGEKLNMKKQSEQTKITAFSRLGCLPKTVFFMSQCCKAAAMAV